MADVIIPHSKWRKLEKALEGLSPLPEMASEEEAAKILGLNTQSLRNKIYDHTIPLDWYTVNALGKRFYFKTKLMGL